MRVAAVTGVIIVLGVTGASALIAQQADSPFRPRQWGAEFQIGTFSSIGLIRFRSPVRALVVNASGSVRKSHSESGTNTGDYNSESLSLRLGLRRYRPVRAEVAAYATVGLTGGYSHQRSTNSSGGSSSSHSATGGLFGALGGQWLVTPHLSLGAEWDGSIVYGYSEGTSSAGGGGSGYTISLGLGGVSLVGAFYF